MKTCPDCNKDLPTSEFGKNKTKKDGLQSRCKKCDREYKKRYYKNNSDKLKERACRRRQEIKEWFQEYKQSLSCEKCGIDKWYLLEFHHPDNNKEGEVADMVHAACGKEKILKEIEKCDVLCANCHRETHYLETWCGS